MNTFGIIAIQRISLSPCSYPASVAVVEFVIAQDRFQICTGYPYHSQGIRLGAISLYYGSPIHLARAHMTIKWVPWACPSVHSHQFRSTFRPESTSVTFWSHLFRVQFFRHFGMCFCNYVCKCVKTNPHAERSEVFKIGPNQASTLLGCLGEPMATNIRPKDAKMMFRGVQNQFKMTPRTGVLVGLIAANGY